MKKKPQTIRVHLIDDDPKFLGLLIRWCKRAGYKATSQIFNGDSCSILRTTPVSRADIIVVDVGLGLADGLDIAKDLRKRLESWGNPGRVALMSALPQNRAKAKAAGFPFFDKESGMEKLFLEALTI